MAYSSDLQMYLLMNPAYRSLLKLKDKAEKENLSADFQSDIAKIIDLIEGRERFSEQQTTSISYDVQKIIEGTKSHPWHKAYIDGKISHEPDVDMLTGKMEVQFLKTLVSIGKVKTVLELGMFTGCSALGIAEALPDDGKVYSCEIEPYIADVAKSFFDQSSAGKKVEIMLGPASDSMLKLAERKMQFDMIFIDADKPNYCQYYKLAFECGLLAPSGTMVVDNALFFGYPYCHENYNDGDEGPAVEKFNEMVLRDDSVHRVLLPIRDGVMVIRRKTDVE